MLNHSREFNMLLVCCISVRLVGTFSLRCLFHLVIFFPSSKTVSLRCSFCFHVDSNRVTTHASNERRLSASHDTRSIRIAITVPCQWHQQESLVMHLSCNCRLVSLRCYHFLLRCQRRYAYLGFVIRNASFAQSQKCLVTMVLYLFLRCQPSTPILGNFAVYHIGKYCYKTSFDHCSLWKTLGLHATRH